MRGAHSLGLLAPTIATWNSTKLGLFGISRYFTMSAYQVPVISVCLPVYNAERFLAEAVESILEQTFKDFEFLILDDGSTDGSPAILAQYAARDPRIRITSRPNKGLVATLNELIDQARGEFIARMDADDVALPERFERQIEHLRANPECVAVGCRQLVIDPEGDPIAVWSKGESHEEMDAGNLTGELGSTLGHPTAMMRRQAVLDIGKYREQFRYFEDVDLFLRLAERGRLGKIAEPLLKYRAHEGNRSNDGNLRAEQDLHQILTEAYLRRGLPVGRLPRQPLTQGPDSPWATHERWAWQALLEGNVATARKYARRLVAKTPFSLSAWRLLYCSIRGR